MLPATRERETQKQLLTRLPTVSIRMYSLDAFGDIWLSLSYYIPSVRVYRLVCKVGCLVSE